MTSEGKANLEWAKQRALEYCDLGDAFSAWQSFTSDLNKQDETRKLITREILEQMFDQVTTISIDDMRRWINSF